MVYHIGCSGWSTSGRSSVCTIQTRGAVNGLADGGGGYQNHFPQTFKPVIPVEVQTTLPDILTVVVKEVDVEIEVVVIHKVKNILLLSCCNWNTMKLFCLMVMQRRWPRINSISGGSQREWACHRVRNWNWASILFLLPRKGWEQKLTNLAMMLKQSQSKGRYWAR